MVWKVSIQATSEVSPSSMTSLFQDGFLDRFRVMDSMGVLLFNITFAIFVLCASGVKLRSYRWVARSMCASFPQTMFERT